MTPFDSSKFISVRAYRIFVDELRRHVGDAKTTITEIDNLNPEQLRRLACSFHTIRGGAGFFGLDRMSQVAGSLEETFAHSLSDVLEQRADVSAWIEEIAEMAAELPEPPLETT